MSEKRADPETGFEVDQNILEYIVYVAIAALVHDAQERAHGSTSQRMEADLTLHMVECGYVFSR